MTTELTGTNGLSSAEAARMLYSWAKTKAARNAADSVDLCWGAGARERMLRMLNQGQLAKASFQVWKRSRRSLHKDLEENIKHKNSIIHDIQLRKGYDLPDLGRYGDIRVCRRTTSPTPLHES